MNTNHKIIAGESFGITMMAFQSANGCIQVCDTAGSNSNRQPADLSGLRIDCVVSTTPLGDRLRGSTLSGADFRIFLRAGETNVLYFNISGEQSFRLTPGAINLAFTFFGDGWTAIENITVGQIVKLR